jgi:hypothetical protein
VSREKLDQERRRALTVAEAKAGIREGHYLLDGNFVDVWVLFYPKVQWWIADARRPRGERIKGTTRKLTDDVKARLESWL